VGGLERLRADLAAIAADAEVVAPDRARAGGVELPVAGASGPVGTLAETLYARHYIRPRADAAPAAQTDAAAFVETLRAANPVAPRQETWTIAAVDAWGLSLVDPRGRQRRAAYQEAAPGPGGFAPGQPVTLAAARETMTAPTGHYAVFGRPIAEPHEGRQVRFYWNIHPAGAAPLLAALGARLDRCRIPFQAKVPAHPAGYARADGGVLYLDAEDVEAARDILAAAYADMRPSMRPETPMFARPLAPGLAFAESPPGGESFGMQRCRLVAEGLVEAFVAAAVTPEARVEAILARVARYGFDLAAIERNAATRYPYRLEGLAA
jgi:hypothetical protein